MSNRAERGMGAAFALGSLCFFVAPFAIYARLVGANADAVTYFVGSIPFTIGGLLQAVLAWSARRSGASGRALWWAAAIQFVGTVWFNLTTLRAITLTPQNAHYDQLVWRPNAYGSACFLASGILLYLASPRRGLRLAHGGGGWWEPEVNLVGCLFFAVSAVAGFAQPRTGALVSPRLTDWTTSLGALCFGACGLAVLLTGWSLRLRPRQLRQLPHLVAVEAVRIEMLVLRR